MVAFFDIETNGLELHEITKIHCISIYIPGTLHEVYCRSRLPQAIEILSNQSLIIGHNSIDYDIPVLKKFYPSFTYKNTIDTLVISRVLMPDREGGHSLKAYANLFGETKVEHEQWDRLSKNMLVRCKSDSYITYKLYKYLCDKITENDKIALRMEHDIAHLMTEMRLNGWLFDKQKAVELSNNLAKEIAEIDSDVDPLLKIKVKPMGTIKSPFTRSGGLLKRLEGYFDEPVEINGPFTKVSFEKVNLGSEKQMKELLLSLGWIPTQWNVKKDKKGKPVRVNGEMITTSPKLTEDSYDSLPRGLGQQLAKRLKCKHRLSLITGLLESIRPDGRLECKVNPCSTNTARMSHKIIVNIPKNDPKVFLGKECRELFKSDFGNLLVGADATALEFRLLAHYINDYLFTDEILKSDIHTVMANYSGLTRNQAKALTYAVIYGASDRKVGSIVNGTIQDGKRLKFVLFNACPSLEDLIQNCKNQAENHGYVVGLDNRKLYTRSSHSALNVLLQSAGAIVMKKALLIAKDNLKQYESNIKLVGHHHDEMTFECNQELAGVVAEIAKQSIIESGLYYKLNCPLDAQSKIGYNWAEIH